MSNRANRRLRRLEQRSKEKVACQPTQEEVQPHAATTHPRLMWLAAAVLAVLATVLGLHHVSRAAAVAPSALVPISKQIVVPAETLPTCVIAHEGDVNAKWLRAVRMQTEGDQVILTLCDDATGERFNLSAPKSTTLPSKADGQGGDLVLARLATVPEHIDLDHFVFSTGPIEKVQKGQRVVSRDPQTGRTELKSVARTFEHKAYELVDLELADAQTGASAEKLRGTPEHPFFTPGGMVPMGKLAAGDRVTTRDGKTLVVKSTQREAHPEGVPVYNFEVEDDHTYFVGQANGGTWVHNFCDIQLHHPWPKYLGGPKGQWLEPLPNDLHVEYHRGLDKFFPRGKGAVNLSPAQRATFEAYTKSFDATHGTYLMDAAVREGY